MEKFALVTGSSSGIGLEIATGMAMYYFNFPFSTQPLHLVIATIMVGIQFYIILESNHRSTDATPQISTATNK